MEASPSRGLEKGWLYSIKRIHYSPSEKNKHQWENNVVSLDGDDKGNSFFLYTTNIIPNLCVYVYDWVRV